MTDRDDWPNAPQPAAAQARATSSVLPSRQSRYQNRNWTAKGRLPSGQMNASELAYSVHLEAERYAGNILWWKFEGLKFRLADNSFYTPDFNVMLVDGQVECHEVKGLWEANARTKIKIVSEMYPFKFIALTKRAKKNGGGWEREEF